MSDIDEKEKKKKSPEIQIRDSNIDEVETVVKTPKPLRKESVLIERQDVELKPIDEVQKINNRGVSNKVSKGLRKTPGKFVDPSTDRCRHLSVDPEEKETRVEKSPSGQSVYYDLIDDDIKYADDDDDESKNDNSKCDIFSGNNVKREDAHVKT